MKLGVDSNSKLTEPDFSKKKNLVFPKLWKKCQKLAKNQLFQVFFQNCVHRCMDFFAESEAATCCTQFSEIASGKNLVLKLWLNMELSNQMARFFKFVYLKIGLTVSADFLYDVIKP